MKVPSPLSDPIKLLQEEIWIKIYVRSGFDLLFQSIYLLTLVEFWFENNSLTKSEFLAFVGTINDSIHR